MSVCTKPLISHYRDGETESAGQGTAAPRLGGDSHSSDLWGQATFIHQEAGATGREGPQPRWRQPGRQAESQGESKERCQVGKLTSHRCTQMPAGVKDVPDAVLDEARAEAGEGLARKIPLLQGRP